MNAVSTHYQQKHTSVKRLKLVRSTKYTQAISVALATTMRVYHRRIRNLAAAVK